MTTKTIQIPAREVRTIDAVEPIGRISVIGSGDGKVNLYGEHGELKEFGFDRMLTVTRPVADKPPSGRMCFSHGWLVLGSTAIMKVMAVHAQTFEKMMHLWNAELDAPRAELVALLRECKVFDVRLPPVLSAKIDAVLAKEGGK